MGLRDPNDPNRATERFTIYMDSTIVKKLREDKARTNRSLKSILEELIKEGYERREFINTG